MGGCASVPKAMRAEPTEVPPPEQPKEETAATTAVEETAAAEEAKAEGGVDAKLKEKAIEVDAPNEIEDAAVVKKEKKIEVAEQK